ncbi:MAG: hypothetical protein ACOX5J_14230 [Candidatus Hydrogenedentales bacterium]
MDKQIVRRKVVWTALVVIALLVSPGCGRFGSRGKKEVSMTASQTVETQRQELSAAAKEQRLREAVEELVADAARVDTPERAPVVKHKPYFLKEYSLYPKGAASAKLQIHETQSRVAPLVGEATIPKQRFATEMHRKKDAAREDSSFYRETGSEILTYHWRNGRWMQVASLFVVDVKEEQGESGWRAVEPQVKEDPFLKGEDEGFVRRMFGGIFGR